MTTDSVLTARLPNEPETWVAVAQLLKQYHGYAGNAPLHVWWKLIPYAGKEISYDDMAALVVSALAEYVEKCTRGRSIEGLLVNNWIGSIFGQLVTIHDSNHVQFEEAIKRALAARKN